MQKPPVIKRLAVLMSALASVALALGTPAGTVIQNVATWQYTTEDGGDVTVPSSPVTTTVAAVCAPSVLPNGDVNAPGQFATLMPGETAFLRYSITNTGNASNTFNLSALTETASQFTPSSISIYQDLNQNGQADAGEGPITSVTLNADASSNLIVRVNTPSSGRGSSYVNLVAACATNVTGNSGERDADNVARVNLLDPPSFTINKTFTPNNVRPGTETVVNISATNTGGASREVTVTDFLNTQDMRDFVYVSGSARVGGTASNALVEYTADGTSWDAVAPATVVGLRARASTVPAGGTISLTFALRAPLADLGTRRNVARLTSEGQSIDAPADVTVKFAPVIALGPINNPEAKPGGELSSDDLQTKSLALVGQEVCFSHTLQNVGDREDTITTTAAVQKGAATIRFKDMSGAVIAQPFTVTLAPQAKTDFQICYTPTQQGGPTEALRVLLTSKSSVGAADNSTVDVISTVGPQPTPPVKTADKSGLVSPGEDITYTLKFTNNQSFALTNVVVRDDLNNLTRGCLAPSRVPSLVTTQRVTGQSLTGQATVLSPLVFVSGDPVPVLEGSVVVWRFPSVAAGQTISMTLKVKVPANAPDCAVITNIFTVSSDEITNPVPSNPVINTVYDSANLRFSKTSTPSTVFVGDTITYFLRVTNDSSSMTLTDLVATDVFPKGLNYIEGSSTLDGVPITPTVTVNAQGLQVFTWKIPGLAPGATAEIRFRAQVTPDASGQLQNSATVTAVASGKVFQTPPVSAANKILPLSFGPNNADIVGYVFIDRNRDGVYDYGDDTPVPNARVILANGRIAVTDAEGRYHYRNVREGEWAVRLDPNSVYAQNLRVPQDAGRSGSRLVYVRNLTSVDFPLVPDGGDIAVIRDTRLTMTAGQGTGQQQFVVRKQVFVNDKDPTLYTVQLNLSAYSPLKAFTLTDPLPNGATLVTGQNTLNIDPLPSGEQVIVYQFHFLGDVKAAVTDPTATWRY